MKRKYKQLEREQEMSAARYGRFSNEQLMQMFQTSSGKTKQMIMIELRKRGFGR